MHPYAYVVWHSPHHRVASAASSCGFRHIIVWLPPRCSVAVATIIYSLRKCVKVGEKLCGMENSKYLCSKNHFMALSTRIFFTTSLFYS